MTGQPTVSDAAFWQALYDQSGDRWELGRPNPVLDAHLARHPPPRGRVAVPGCGRGHDARLLAGSGYPTWGFDFAPGVIGTARELAARDGVTVTFEERDVFGPAGTYSAFFDGVWEYTCFCAIDPARRAEYVDVLASILKPGGWLLACFFPMGDRAERPGGPPFAASEDEVRGLLAPRFELVQDHRPSESTESTGQGVAGVGPAAGRRSRLAHGLSVRSPAAPAIGAPRGRTPRFPPRRR